MSNWEDRILNVLAGIVARFILGVGAVWGFFYLVDRDHDNWSWEYTMVKVLIGLCVGLAAGVFWTRKGPGAV